MTEPTGDRGENGRVFMLPVGVDPAAITTADVEQAVHIDLVPVMPAELTPQLEPAWTIDEFQQFIGHLTPGGYGAGRSTAIGTPHSAPGLIDRINHELDAWERGRDAARWSPDDDHDDVWESADSGYTWQRNESPSRVDAAMSSALAWHAREGSFSFRVAELYEQYAQALATALSGIADLAESMGLLRRLAKAAAARPTSHAATRTTSPRRRAGSRRTKRHARRSHR